MAVIQNINFSGASSTGKSTICRYCAALYDEPCSLEQMPGYLIQNKMRIEDIQNETFLICSKLHDDDMQEKKKQAREYLFIDSGPLIFYLGNKYSFGRDFRKLKEMAIDFYQKQDCVFVCDPHIPFDTKQMRGDEGTKDILHKEIVKFLATHNIEYTLLEGSVPERAATVYNALLGLESARQDLSEQIYREQLCAPLRILARAYLETNGPMRRKKNAIAKIISTNRFVFSKAPLARDILPDISIIKKLSQLRDQGVLTKSFDIVDARKFVQSDLLKKSDGLGFIRDLTTRPVCKHLQQATVQNVNNQNREEAV